MIAYGYIRVSGLGQVEGDGPIRQMDSVRKFCEAHGLKLESFFQDLGVSGTTDGLDRPDFARLLAHIESTPELGPVCVVVERMDRLARDLMVSEIMITELRKRNVILYSVDRGLVDVVNDEGDPMKKFVRQLMAALAELDRAMITARMQVARSRIRAKTGRCEGRHAFSPEIEAEVEAAIARMLPLRYSERQIIKILADSGYFPVGGKWSTNTGHLIIKRVKDRSQKEREAHMR